MSHNRRRHRVFYTKHTEYHVRGEECVGVRDRMSGLWMVDHAALRLRAVRIPPIGQGDEFIGQRIQFWGRHADVLTSPVTGVGRPERKEVGAYVSHARAGGFGPAGPDEPTAPLGMEVPPPEPGLQHCMPVLPTAPT